MKKLKTNVLLRILGVFLVFASLASCSDDDSAGTGGAPTVDSVSLAQNDSLVDKGYADNMYIIRGKGFTGLQKVYFNDTDTYFNPAFVTDTAILVTIDRNTPYENAPDEMKLVTNRGTVVYTFVVAPPAPIVGSINPVNTPDGEQFTIYGSFFLDPVVTVGGVPAEIVSSTLTRIVAIMPAGSNRKKVAVSTISGESEWSTAVGTAIYDDAFYAPWDIESWNNHEYVTNESEAFQGTTFIKKTINGWDNIQGNWNYDETASQYTGIHFSIRSNTPGKLVLVFNGNGWGDATKSFETTTQWKEYTYTWAELGGVPAALQNITFQEFTGEAHDYYFDNIGYTVD